MFLKNKYLYFFSCILLISAIITINSCGGSGGASSGNGSSTDTEDKAESGENETKTIEEECNDALNWICEIFANSDGTEEKITTTEQVETIVNEAKEQIANEELSDAEKKGIATSVSSKIILGYFKAKDNNSHLDSTGINYGTKIKDMINLALFLGITYSDKISNV